MGLFKLWLPMATYGYLLSISLIILFGFEINIFKFYIHKTFTAL